MDARDVRAASPAAPQLHDYWALGEGELWAALGADRDGLTRVEAERRLGSMGRNVLARQARPSWVGAVYEQLKSPLVSLLVFAAVISSLTGEWVDAGLVLTIIAASVGVGAQREYSAATAAAALTSRIGTRATVLRDGALARVPAEDVVPGDIIDLAAGSIVPADAVVLTATDCFVNEAVLTGESYEAEKRPGAVPAGSPLRERRNVVYLGSNVRSGTARCLVVATGSATEYGAIAERLSLRPPESEFDRGVREFGSLLTRVMVLMGLLVFAAHVVMGRPPIDTLLFAVALAVGISPELLPAVLTVNLARGARMMAERGVLVRRLAAIENLGSMDVLCTDKTGTLTEGVVKLEGAYDAHGAPAESVLELAALNAAFQTGLPSALDGAILEARPPSSGTWHKRGEIPFDFARKRLSVVLEREGRVELITKGAFRTVLEVSASLDSGEPLDDARRAALVALHAEWAARGIRVLAVASRRLSGSAAPTREDERELVFRGFLAFLDRPKAGAREALIELGRLGVKVKIITGDARLVTEHVARSLGIAEPRVATAAELDALKGEALWDLVEHTDAFVEVDPGQKERIILALKQRGHVVGFLGDGVNDAPAMHASDTSLSVDEAVDVAREAADFVLLEKDLEVLRRGIEAGRRTFANTLKYVLTTTSANLGNMLSMALISPLLPFLPLTAGQILLNNFLSDIPAVGLADDSVDAELVSRPRRWDMSLIRRFMLQFGLLSSIFDGVAFAVLLLWFRAGVEQFRTGWFVCSLLTELVIALVVRTRRVFYLSRPGRLLWASTLVLAVFALVLPYVPGAHVLGFTPLPLELLGAVVVITGAYVLSAELLKRWFYRAEDPPVLADGPARCVARAAAICCTRRSLREQADKVP